VFCGWGFGSSFFIFPFELQLGLDYVDFRKCYMLRFGFSVVFFFFFFILLTFYFVLFTAVPLVSLSASMFYMQLQPGVLSN